MHVPVSVLIGWFPSCAVSGFPDRVMEDREDLYISWQVHETCTGVGLLNSIRTNHLIVPLLHRTVCLHIAIIDINLISFPIAWTG